MLVYRQGLGARGGKAVISVLAVAVGGVMGAGPRLSTPIENNIDHPKGQEEIYYIKNLFLFFYLHFFLI